MAAVVSACAIGLVVEGLGLWFLLLALLVRYWRGRRRRATTVRFGGGWCENEKCECHRPGLPCEEFMGPADEDELRCPRCGWSEGAHPPRR